VEYHGPRAREAHAAEIAAGERQRREAAASPSTPGWYASEDPAFEVYWDGSEWTQHRPATPSGATQAAPPVFAYEIRTPGSADDFRQKVLAPLSGTLASLGYVPNVQMDVNASFSRRYSPAGFIALYILLFPIGLLFLLARPVQTLSISWREADGGIVADVRGSDKRLIPILASIESATPKW
jgi:hypothetical protein